MVALAPHPFASLGWRARRPWLRRQLRAALLAAAPDRRWLTVAEAAGASGLEEVPNAEVEAALTELVSAGVAEGLRGPRGWSHVRALMPPAEPFIEEAVTVRQRRSEVPVAGSVASGLRLFGVALVLAVIAAALLIHSWSDAGGPAALTRAGWYQQAARGFVAAHQDHESGFNLPYRFAEVTGVREDANRLALEMGMIRYLQAALFTGYPSQGGILAWARAQFGELPPGPAADAWIRRAAETYAARSLAGIPGYEIPPALQAAGAIAPGERNPAALADGLVRALRAALYLGTPDTGGVLDWARRTLGDLPRE